MRPASCGDRAGTHAGVNAHNRAWEPLCEACRVFRADYARARRRSGQAREKARQQAALRHWAVKQLISRHRSEFAELLAQAREVLS